MNRSISILVIILIVLGVAAYFLIAPSTKEHVKSYDANSFDISLDSASITKFEIKSPEKSFTFENVGGKWMITSPGRYQVNLDQVKQFLGSLSKLKVGSLVSSNPEKQSLYQVDSTGTLLSIFDRSGKSLHLIVGKMGPSFSDVYVRESQSNDVYLCSGINSWTLRQELSAWREKRIFSASKEEIKQLTYERKGKVYVIERDSLKWRYHGDTIAIASMSPALHNLEDLRADDFIDTAYTPATQPMKLTIQTNDNFILTFYPIPPDSSQYYLETSFTEQRYTINRWTVNELFKPIEGQK